jgi:hypothetical protein
LLLVPPRVRDGRDKLGVARFGILMETTPVFHAPKSAVRKAKSASFDSATAFDAMKVCVRTTVTGRMNAGECHRK